jgi:hypothetical protein
MEIFNKPQGGCLYQVHGKELTTSLSFPKLQKKLLFLGKVQKLTS